MYLQEAGIVEFYLLSREDSLLINHQCDYADITCFTGHVKFRLQQMLLNSQRWGIA